MQRTVDSTLQDSDTTAEVVGRRISTAGQTGFDSDVKSKSMLRAGRTVAFAVLCIVSVFVLSLNVSILRPKSKAVLHAKALMAVSRPSIASNAHKVNFNSNYGFENNFFNISSAPERLVSSLRGIIGGPECETDRQALVTACCHSLTCGGFSDRIKGLATLLVVAKLTKRRLCFAKDFFIAARKHICPASEGIHAIITYDDVKILRAVSEGQALKEPGELKRLNDLQKNIRFVSTAFQLPQYQELGSSEKHSFAPSHHRIGMIALAISRVVNTEMIAAQNVIESALVLRMRGTKMVSLHTRCGGSPFTVGQGVRIDKTTGADNSFQLELPQLLLLAARALPRNLLCQNGLYIASDSTHFRAEMQIALPKGVSGISCCSASYHIDQVRPSEPDAAIQQHLVDIQAFARSEQIFGTGGGFATSGRNGRHWEPVPMVRMQNVRGATSSDAKDFMQKIVTAMNCTLHKRQDK